VDGYGNEPDEAKQAAYNARAAGWDLTPFETVDAAEQWLLDQP